MQRSSGEDDPVTEPQQGSVVSPTAASRQRVTARAVLLALLLTPVQSWLIVQMEVVRENNWPTMLALPLHTIFILLLITLASLGLKRIRPRWALAQSELLTIYVMLAISGVIVGWGQLNQVISWAIAPIGRATPENQWEVLFTPYLKPWLVLMDRESLHAIYNGDSSLFAGNHLRTWIPIALSWGAFILAFFGVMMSLNALLRRRWIEEERLTFPLVQVPLAVTEPTATIFRSSLFWIGVGVAVTIGMLNGMSALFPALPSLQPDFSKVNSFLFRWGCFRKHGGVLWPPYPWAVGVSMLMPLDVSSSFWLFFWLVKIEEWVTLLLGWDITPDAPFVYQQAASALLAVGAYVLWSARKRLWTIITSAMNSHQDLGDRNEPLPYRGALILFVLSLGFLCFFLAAAGMPLLLVPIYLGMFLCASLALSRIPAEFGAPLNEVHDAEPHRILTQITTPASIPVRGLVVLTELGWTSRSYGMDPTPHQMGGFKMAERTNLNTRMLVGAMFLAAIAGLFWGYLSLLTPLYRLGVDTSKMIYNNSGRNAFTELDTWLTGVAPAPGYRGIAMGFGMAFTFFLYAMRSRFLWWPFHPIGYLLAPMANTHHLWPSVFLGWIVKLILLRYGGLRAYSRALPLFFGLIIGDCIIGSLWTLVGLVFEVKTLRVWGLY